MVKDKRTDLEACRRLKFGSLSEPFLPRREDGMRTKTGMLLMILSSMVAPAAAQDAKSLLQAADKAIGASAVNSVQYSGTGFTGAVGQSFATEGAGSDWPRTDFKSYSATIDYASKSSKEEHVRVQGNNVARGGGFVPLQGEVRTTNFVSDASAWNLNQQGQPNPQPGAAQSGNS